MKKLNISYKKLLTLIFLITITFSYSWSQDFTKNKKIERVFRAGTSTNLHITNKYGRVQILTWNKDSVKINIDLTIKSKSTKKLKKLESGISFDISETKYYIVAKTISETKYSDIMLELKKIGDSFISSKNQVEINYTITMPNYIDLKIDNKYGNVYTDNLKGQFNLFLSNGDFKANNLTGNNNIEIKFGNGVVNSISSGKINILYSDFQIKKANQLNISSKSSKINIGDINTLKIQSRRDKYYISKIDYLYGETSFSNLWVYNLTNEINFNMNYGGLNLELIKKSFSLLNIYSQYTDLNLFFEKESSYNIEIINKKVVLNYPKELANLKEKSVNDAENRFLAYGTIGNNQSSSKVKIEAESCNINIVHKY